MLKSTSLVAFDNCYHYQFLFSLVFAKGELGDFSMDSMNAYLHITLKYTMMSDQKRSRKQEQREANSSDKHCSSVHQGLTFSNCYPGGLNFKSG